MFFIRTIRHLVAWIGCFAILAAALAPTVSHALAKHDATRSLLTEVCSVEGKQWQVIELAVAGKSSSVPHAQHFEDCSLCLTQSDAGLLRQENAALLLVVSDSQQLPSLFYQASRTLFVWATPQSRAPPFQS